MPYESNGITWWQTGSTTTARAYLSPDGAGDFNFNLIRGAASDNGFRMDRNGNITIGTSNSGPSGSALRVSSPSNTDYAAAIINGGGDGLGLLIRASSGTGGSTVPLLRVETTGGIERLVVTEGGLTRMKTLQIVGGSDLAEPFRIAKNERNADLRQPGMVMVIDPENPGGLMPATQPYDKRVAGVISGANGLNPGMIMKAEGNEHADGEHPVALTGRVWCWCDATAETGGGPIGPGDRLTTSSTPGHAMKVTDHSKAPGSVIGKAMTRLDDGYGMVLVLVNLQ